MEEEEKRNQLAVDEGSPTKLELETLKLTKEISKIDYDLKEQAKPFYLKPSFLSLFIPLMVPIVTFLAYYFLGGGKYYFDIKSENLKHQQFAIEKQLTDLRDSAKIQREVFAKKQANLKLEYSKKEMFYLSKQDSLKKTVDSLQSIKITLGQVISKLNSDIKNKDIYVKLNSLRKETNGYQNSIIIPDLILLIKSDPQRWERLMLAEMKSDTNKITRFKEYLILLKGTGRQVYIDSMFSLASAKAKQNGASNQIFKDGFFWLQLGCSCDPATNCPCTFSSFEKHEIIKRLVSIANKYNVSANYFTAMTGGISNFPDKEFTLEQIDKRTFIDFILLLKKYLLTAQNVNLPQSIKDNILHSNLDLLSKYAPMASVVYLCQVITTNNAILENADKNKLLEQLRWVKLYNNGISELTSLDVKTWENWKNRNKQIYDFWTNSNEDTLRDFKNFDAGIIGKRWFD